MDMTNRENPSQSVPAGVVLSAEKDSVVFSREPPPPYTIEAPVAVQPVLQQRYIQPLLKGTSIFYNCDKCGQRVLTKVEYENTNKTHLCAGFICGFTFWCLLCCLAAIPYLVTPCKKALHYCPNCNTFFGAYSKC